MSESKFICKHETFSAKVDVNRCTAFEGGPVTNYSADVSIFCDVCGLPFRFLCPDAGVVPDRPAVSVDATEIRLPITPSDQPDMASGVGFVIRPAVGADPGGDA